MVWQYNPAQHRVSHLTSFIFFKLLTFGPAARTYDNLDACEVVRSSHLTTAAMLLEVTPPHAQIHAHAHISTLVFAVELHLITVGY